MADGKGLPGSRFLGLGLELAAAVGGMALVGYWVDRHFETGGWGVLTGALLGLTGGLYNFIKVALKIARSGGGEVGDSGDLAATTKNNGADWQRTGEQRSNSKED